MAAEVFLAMTITIELPQELAERLRAVAEAQGEDLNYYAVAALTKIADRAEAQAIDDEAMTREERDAMHEGIRRGLDDFENGRHRPADEVFAEVRAKHGFGRAT